MVKCALCKGKTPALTKTLCNECHVIKEFVTAHGRDSVIAVLKARLGGGKV